MAITTVPAITARVASEGTGKLKPLLFDVPEERLFRGFLSQAALDLTFWVLFRANSNMGLLLFVCAGLWLNWFINPVLKPADLLPCLEEDILRLFETCCFSIIDAILGISTKKAFGII
ncbi:MAG: hypothetical protein FWD22_04130 [Treponema sp.]|nr:hypothetical protein [Treponema sp.]